MQELARKVALARKPNGIRRGCAGFELVRVSDPVLPTRTRGGEGVRGGGCTSEVACPAKSMGDIEPLFCVADPPRVKCVCQQQWKRAHKRRGNPQKQRRKTLITEVSRVQRYRRLKLCREELAKLGEDLDRYIDAEVARRFQEQIQNAIRMSIAKCFMILHSVCRHSRRSVRI